MDLLSQRYASPFLVLDDFIRLHQLHDFVVEIFNKISKEKIEGNRWEFYLHKVYRNITFEKYIEMCEEEQRRRNADKMTHKQIGNVIESSKKMLAGIIHV